MAGELDPEIAAQLDEAAARIFGKDRGSAASAAVVNTVNGHRAFVATRDVNIYIQSVPRRTPRKPQDWRVKRIAAIQSVCTKRDWHAWRKEYMTRFDAASMVEMDDAQIEDLYRATMSKAS